MSFENVEYNYTIEPFVPATESIIGDIFKGIAKVIAWFIKAIRNFIAAIGRFLFGGSKSKKEARLSNPNKPFNVSSVSAGKPSPAERDAKINELAEEYVRQAKKAREDLAAFKKKADDSFKNAAADNPTDITITYNKVNAELVESGYNKVITDLRYKIRDGDISKSEFDKTSKEIDAIFTKVINNNTNGDSGVLRRFTDLHKKGMEQLSKFFAELTASSVASKKPMTDLDLLDRPMASIVSDHVHTVMASNFNAYIDAFIKWAQDVRNYLANGDRTIATYRGVIGIELYDVDKFREFIDPSTKNTTFTYHDLMTTSNITTESVRYGLNTNLEQWVSRQVVNAFTRINTRVDREVQPRIAELRSARVNVSSTDIDEMIRNELPKITKNIVSMSATMNHIGKVMADSVTACKEIIRRIDAVEETIINV